MRLIHLFHLSMLGLAMSFSSHSYAQTTIDTTTSEATTPRADAGVTPTPAEDTTITNSIKSQIADSATLSTLNITVQANQGVVTLSGTVDSDSQVSSLVELSEAVVGVKDVDASNLNVKNSQQPIADTIITAKIKGLFIREKVFGDKDIAALNISVETKNGVVYLTGAIDNPEQLKNAMALIRTVKGVTSVEYNVKKVEPAIAPAHGS